MAMKIFNGYLVSEDGTVYNSQGHAKRTTIQGTTGYTIVTLYYGGHPHTHGVHRLVAELFIPRPAGVPDRNMFVEHIDGNRKNNAVTNLRWSVKQLHLSALNPSIKVIVEDINGNKSTFDSLTKAAKAYGVTTSAASGYVKGKFNDKSGRKWSYAV